MKFMQDLLKSKISHINTIMHKIEGNKRNSLVDLLKEEIEKLKKLNLEYKEALDSKKVLYKEVENNKVRYYLKDGSTYVIRSKYKYLYDNKSKVVTYEFENGQIERTLPFGIKEIRYPDGTITIKSNEKEYEVLNK